MAQGGKGRAKTRCCVKTSVLIYIPDKAVIPCLVNHIHFAEDILCEVGAVASKIWPSVAGYLSVGSYRPHDFFVYNIGQMRCSLPRPVVSLV